LRSPANQARQTCSRDCSSAVSSGLAAARNASSDPAIANVAAQLQVQRMVRFDFMEFLLGEDLSAAL
jgi:hypothetical protein